MLREDAVRKLTDFGLSVNQAKVYLNIVQDGPVPVNRISTVTGLHRQDIYKILPKLEKKGLITKKIGKPILLNAIRPDQALSSLISREEKKANEKALKLKTEMREILKGFQQRHTPDGEQDSNFFIVTGDDAVASRAFEVIASCKKQHDGHLGEDLLLRFPKTKWRQAFRADHLQNGAKRRLLIGVLRKEDSVEKLIEAVRPPGGVFLAKIIERETFDEYMVVDNKAFVITQKSPILSALLTNSESLVRILKENFEAMWNSPRAKQISGQ